MKRLSKGSLWTLNPNYFALGQQSVILYLRIQLSFHFLKQDRTSSLIFFFSCSLYLDQLLCELMRRSHYTSENWLGKKRHPFATNKHNTIRSAIRKHIFTTHRIPLTVEIKSSGFLFLKFVTSLHIRCTVPHRSSRVRLEKPKRKTKKFPRKAPHFPLDPLCHGLLIH